MIDGATGGPGSAGTVLHAQVEALLVATGRVVGAVIVGRAAVDHVLRRRASWGLRERERDLQILGTLLMLLLLMMMIDELLSSPLLLSPPFLTFLASFFRPAAESRQTEAVVSVPPGLALGVGAAVCSSARVLAAALHAHVRIRAVPVGLALGVNLPWRKKKKKREKCSKMSTTLYLVQHHYYYYYYRFAYSACSIRLAPRWSPADRRSPPSASRRRSR